MTSAWIPVVAFVGLVNAAYLLYKKTRNEKLTCFIGHDCDSVTKSKYGYIFGISNEAFGIGFYLLVLALFFLSFLGVTSIPGLPWGALLLLLAIPASLTSLYLLGVQAFILKKWCDYCILSVFINFSIHYLAMLGEQWPHG
jgi:uncharacterized membrane protein